MKNFTRSLALICLVSIAFTACKKDKNKTNTPTGQGATVTAKNFGFDGAGGSSFTASAAGIVKVGPVFTISAVRDNSTNAISIVLYNITQPGTYTLDADNSDGNGAIISKNNTTPGDLSSNYSTGNSGGGNIGGGQVVITKLTATDAEGTFYITGYNNAGKAAFAEQGAFKGHVNTANIQ